MAFLPLYFLIELPKDDNIWHQRVGVQLIYKKIKVKPHATYLNYASKLFSPRKSNNWFREGLVIPENQLNIKKVYTL